MRMHDAQPSAGFAILALQASERARARILLEQLAEARADIRQGIDATLLARERGLAELLNAKAEREKNVLFNVEPGQVDTARYVLLIVAAYLSVRFPLAIFGAVVYGFTREQAAAGRTAEIN